MGVMSVFPTSVGVFLKLKEKELRKECFPHVRGGVSWTHKGYDIVKRFSPRPWGCFLPVYFFHECG